MNQQELKDFLNAASKLTSSLEKTVMDLPKSLTPEQAEAYKKQLEFAKGMGLPKISKEVQIQLNSLTEAIKKFQ